MKLPPSNNSNIIIFNSVIFIVLSPLHLSVESANYEIQHITKNILFDEKIGGSIHMAIGQSYLQ